jgi:hypothetical protein
VPLHMARMLLDRSAAWQLNTDLMKNAMLYSLSLVVHPNSADPLFSAQINTVPCHPELLYRVPLRRLSRPSSLPPLTTPSP